MRKYLFFPLLLSLAVCLCACQIVTPAPDLSSSNTPRPPTQVKTATLPSPSPTPLPSLSVDQLSGMQIHVRHPFIGEHEKRFEGLVANFNRENAWGIQVEAVSVPGLEALGLQLSTESLAEDLVIAMNYDLLAASDLQSWIPLNRYMQDGNFGIEGLYGASSPFTAFAPLATEGEARYSLPLAYQPGLIFYNETWTGELDTSNPPQTLSAFQQNLQKAREAKQKEWLPGGGLLLASTPLSAQSWYAAMGATWQAQEAPNAQAVQSAFAWLKEGVLQGYTWTKIEDYPGHALVAREALAYEGSLDDLPTLLSGLGAQKSHDQLRALPYPTQDGRGSIALESLAMALRPSDEAHQNAAWLFLRYLLEVPAQKALVEVHGLWPATGAPASIAPQYAKDFPLWAEALSSSPRLNLAAEDEHWVVRRALVQDAFSRLYQLDGAYFSVVIEALQKSYLDEGQP